MLNVPAADESPLRLTRVRIADWISRAKESRTGLDDLAFWQDEIAKLGVGSESVTLVVDDGRMTEAARGWFILQYFGLPVVVLNGGISEVQALPPQAAQFHGPLSLMPEQKQSSAGLT